jgi:hypothetical protein
LRVDVRHHEREGIVRAGLDGRKDVGEGEALVGETWRALSPSPPDVAGAPLLPDTCLVLEEEADTLVFMRMLKFSEQRRGFF